ncbi:Protein of unknown function (DUF3464) [Synechococcus sp. PCC 7502]|uniref:PAM68 family protein n=1 Tax=Synechococcus sp. PCC 7502 TaxID=1173263 RepID=UPI00029FD6F7|nr:PAM68 family protein [Synechococcus sp. PCC 7502]AFY73249.1 Protein of unknown function (DUF3464) [Synechococcus sp. PCC 7502]
MSRSEIPFEPNSGKKPKNNKIQGRSPVIKSSQKPEQPAAANSIPPEVNRRLVRRAALFCGIPTSLGFLTFIASYIIVVKKWADLPNSAVVLVSMLFLGIGVLGLSYGALSASWDENREGHWWGWQEFKQNFGYLREAWKAQRAEKLSSQKPD